MKKILALSLILCLTILTACNSNDTTYTLKFVAYYPNNPDTITLTNHAGYSWHSQSGTNYILTKENMFNNRPYSSSAPFKILEYSKQPK